MRYSTLKTRYEARSKLKRGMGDCLSQLFLLMQVPLKIENDAIIVYKIENDLNVDITNDEDIPIIRLIIT